MAAEREVERFPGATLHWFDGADHYPHWGSPAAAKLILETTS